MDDYRAANSPFLCALRASASLRQIFARHSAIIALAVFAIVGVAILDDYGMTLDSESQRNVGYASFNYIFGDDEALIEGHHDRYYVVAFEVPLIVVERLLRLEDSRAIYLSRHLITHLFFLAGGFFAWLLAYRLFGSRLIALLAMLIFLLHPRIYAHSFINTKDLPFLSMFMVSLYLTHRAFRRDALWAFALCGAGVGLLANIRVVGAALAPAVLALLALDAVHAARRGGWTGARRTFANAGAFAAAFAATLYAAWPLLWSDLANPSTILDALRVLYRHSFIVPTLFRGEWVRWPQLPWDYIPTWILITTPPVALALAAIGIVYAARLCAADWRGALANSTARFGLLAAACLIMPVAAAIALNSNTFNGWRHMYFLYAPLCVLAAFGLRALAAIPKPSLRAAAFALAALGLAAAAIQMISLHPYQNDYFNALADKSALAERWGMDYWHVSHREALETLLEIQPTGTIALSDPLHDHVKRSAMILPKDDRRRFAISPQYPSFHIVSGHPPGARDALAAGETVIWKREVYGVPIVWIADARAESAAALADAYAAARQSPPAANGGGFDIYRTANSLIYIKETCGEEDAGGTFQLSIIPSHREDAPAGRAYESTSFGFWTYGAIFGGKCLIAFPLPDYPIHAIETKTLTDSGEGAAWETIIPLGDSLGEYAAALSAPPGERAASGGGFDIYADGDTLIYIKETCDEEDARGRFFLSVFPVDPNDLPQSARDAGREHQSLNFDFWRHGAILDGKCAIIRYLPSYAISRIETGQWLPGAGELWRAEMAIGD